MIDSKNWKSWFTFFIFLTLAASLISGCSVKFEAGYHGKTGRDDTTVTENFIQSAKQRKY